MRQAVIEKHADGQNSTPDNMLSALCNRRSRGLAGWLLAAGLICGLWHAAGVSIVARRQWPLAKGPVGGAWPAAVIGLYAGRPGQIATS